MKNYFYLACLLLVACSNLPPAIEDPPAYNLGYSEAISNLGKVTNAPIRWGGKIVEVENEPTYSALQILAYPVSRNGRPAIDDASQGRFVVKSPTFLDPAVYKKETPVTVAGVIAGDTERKIGNKPLRLPLITASNIFLWQQSDYFRDNYYGGYGGGGGYGYPYGGFYGYGPYYPGALYGYSPYFRGGGYYSPYGYRH